MSFVNIAVIGMGHWGPNLARNVAQLPSANLHSVCDVREERLRLVERQYPGTQHTTEHLQVLEDSAVDAVVIATPAESHFHLAKESISAGKHVLVEKPLATNTTQCQELINLADRMGKVLMVGHVFRYNAAVQKLKSYIEDGELGEIYYISSSRLNLGKIRSDINALWNFAPHDLSIIFHLMEMMPTHVNCRGFAFIQDSVEDVIFMTLRFPNGSGAHVHISWLDPRKMRTMTIVGSKKMIVYDDSSADSKIRVYDKGVTKIENSMSLGDYESFGEFQLLLRAGDVLIPKIDFVEPLRTECQHFVDCILEGKRPITDGWEGLRVVKVLEAAQESMENEGRPEVIHATHVSALDPVRHGGSAEKERSG